MCYLWLEVIKLLVTKTSVVVAITLSLVLFTATIANTLKYQKPYAHGGLIDKVQQSVNRVGETVSRSVSR